MNEETNQGFQVFTYPISYDELIQTWVRENEKFGHCIIVYEPSKYEEYLKDINLPYVDTDMYFTEVMCIEFIDFDSAKKLLTCFNYQKGPYVQFWSNAKLITDNIETSILDL